MLALAAFFLSVLPPSARSQGAPTSQPAATPLGTTRPDPSPEKGATYYRIPIHGVIGEDFTAERMKAALDQAEKSGGTIVLLELDTPGGVIDDAEKIVDMIASHKNLRFVAFVRQALSAGATITLACSEIYMADTAMIGAAVSYRPDGRGGVVELPPDVAEKFQSVWRAVCRKAAEQGGHNPLLAEAMVDKDFALTMRNEGDKILIERDGKGDLIKAKGRILTLTAREAVNCGLANATVDSIAKLTARLNLRPTDDNDPDHTETIETIAPKLPLLKWDASDLEKASNDHWIRRNLVGKVCTANDFIVQEVYIHDVGGDKFADVFANKKVGASEIRVFLFMRTDVLFDKWPKLANGWRMTLRGPVSDALARPPDPPDTRGNAYVFHFVHSEAVKVEFSPPGAAAAKTVASEERGKQMDQIPPVKAEIADLTAQLAKLDADSGAVAEYIRLQAAVALYEPFPQFAERVRADKDRLAALGNIAPERIEAYKTKRAELSGALDAAKKHLRTLGG